MPSCFSCGKEVILLGAVGFREECLSCQSDLHVCKNCEFYDKTAYNECRETQADRIVEKEKANYCEFFKFRMSAVAQKKEKDHLLSQAEALFKKNSVKKK